MKILGLVLLLTIAITLADSSHVLAPRDSDDLLDLLQGNNYNVYLLFFEAVNPFEEYKIRNNRDIEAGIQKILVDNPDVYYARIHHTNPHFQKLIHMTEVHAAPSVFLMTHGKGVWIYEGSSELILDRLKEFLTQFKQAASKNTDPY